MTIITKRALNWRFNWGANEPRAGSDYIYTSSIYPIFLNFPVAPCFLKIPRFCFKISENLWHKSVITKIHKSCINIAWQCRSYCSALLYTLINNVIHIWYIWNETCVRITYNFMNSLFQSYNIFWSISYYMYILIIR